MSAEVNQRANSTELDSTCAARVSSRNSLVVERPANLEVSSGLPSRRSLHRFQAAELQSSESARPRYVESSKPTMVPHDRPYLLRRFRAGANILAFLCLNMAASLMHVAGPGSSQFLGGDLRTLESERSGPAVVEEDVRQKLGGACYLRQGKASFPSRTWRRYSREQASGRSNNR